MLPIGLRDVVNPPRPPRVRVSMPRPRVKPEGTYYARHKAERIAYAKAYRMAHPEKVRKWKRDHYHRHAARIAAESRAYYLKNRAAIARRKRERKRAGAPRL